MVLVHHVGRKSGKEYVSPVVYLPKDGDDESPPHAGFGEYAAKTAGIRTIPVLELERR
jgi:hypothetical protein